MDSRITGRPLPLIIDGLGGGTSTSRSSNAALVNCAVIRFKNSAWFCLATGFKSVPNPE